MSEDVKQRESQVAHEYELPDGWIWTTLGRIGEYINGRAFKPTEWEEEGRPIIRIQNLTKSTSVVNRYSEPIEEKYIVRNGDLLISWSATLGAFIYRGEEAVLNQHIFKVKPYIDKMYLYYLVTAFIDDLKHQVHGSGMQHITKTKFERSRVPLAPLTEQRRIVDAIETHFTRLDAAVAALERAQANLARYRASVLQAAVEGRLVPTEADLAREERRDYEPADALLERILEERRARWEAERWQYEIERAKKKAAQAERKAAGLPYYIRQLPEASWIDRTEEEYAPYLPKSDRWKQKYNEPEPPDTKNLPELPEGWRWTSTEQIGEILGGLTKNSKRKRYPLRMPYLRVANVYADELRLDEIKQIGVKESELDRVLLEKSDLLIVEGNGSIDQIGRVAVWDGSITPCVHQNHLIKVRLVLSQMAKYVLYWLLSIGGREQIIDVASSTSGLYTLSLSKVSQLPVPLPPLAEQRRIVKEVERRLSVVDALEEAVEADLTRAERLRQAILKTAFEGRLVPQNPDDEPASALLARIRLDLNEKSKHDS